MPPTPTSIQDLTCQVVSNRECGHGLKILRLQPVHAGQSFQCLAGQFVMLDLPVSQFHFRRPFSVLSVQEDGSFDIYYKRVGTGTNMMWDMVAGQQLQCLGPLGIGFTQPQSLETALYIGGGIGIAPLALLAASMRTENQPTGHCFYGIRSQNEVGLAAELASLFDSRLHISTDDGSAGIKGNVCDLLNTHQEIVLAAKEAYICGPMRMMEATVMLLSRLNPNLKVQVSLESHMPCGTGACTGCVVPRADQYLPSKVCVEGPVFEAQNIQWQNGQPQLAVSAYKEASCPL